MSIRRMKKEIPGSHYFFLCTEQFTYTSLFTFSQDRAAHFFWTCKMYIYYLLLDLFASLCHILYFDAAKFSIKLFSFIYFCCQTTEWIWNSDWQGFRGVLKSLKFSYIKFKDLKILKLYKKVLIMISRGLKFGDGKTRIAIWLNVTIKLQKAMKHERCTFKVRSCADLCTGLTGETVISTKRVTCWQRMNVQFQ